MNCAQVNRMFLALARKYKFTFGGCVSVDTFCKINLNVKKTVIYCVNTHESSNSSMGHWILFQLQRKSVAVFDSYNLPLELYNSNFAEFLNKCRKMNKRIFITSMELQAETSLVCGLYVVLAAEVLVKYGIRKFKKVFFKIFNPKNTRKKNDQIVLTHFYQHKSGYSTPDCVNTFCRKGDKYCVSECKRVVGK